MKILDYIELVELINKTELERTKYLCYYHYREKNVSMFTMALILDLFTCCGFNRPNATRLKNKLIKGKDKIMLLSKEKVGTLIFIPVIFQSLEKELSGNWTDTLTIESNSELFEESKFCGKRNFLDRLIRQINFSYSNNCFDGCAVLMRRLFEVLLVLSYQNLEIEACIIDEQGNHFMLERLVKEAVQNKSLNLSSRVRKHLNSFREVGNNSAHSITYTAGKKDIDDIKTNYRVMMEELYNKAGLI
ncbi:MAG: hypothetical protein CVV48_01800 [Spirochaetae bacterium HGW-Spirochaetae-4]|jgi:hypothetical protein|nr:MAG: hypothetical protein CVV48_01800 [Spirochaetae bacterium HGW-Spirochaetae-4]